MKKGLMLLAAVVIFHGIASIAHATLFLRGADSLGNQLIYDDDLNITWYDYTKSWDEWWNQVNWVDALSVDFGGTVYGDWRLPTALNPDLSGPCRGFGCTGSEMGHLFYTELGNLGYYATSGPDPQPGWGLTNTGPFQNLQANHYWSGTEWADPEFAWCFIMGNGNQHSENKTAAFNFAIAVRPGDVAAVPEPGAILILGSGLVGLFAGRRMLRR